MPKISSYSGELANRLQDYRARGNREAGKNRPPPDASHPDQHESELKSEAEGWLSGEQRLFDSALTEVSRAATEARQKAIELKTTFDQLLGDDAPTSMVEAELAGERSALVQATEARLRAQADLNYFRNANDIHEEARYPDSIWWHFGVLAVLALIEVAVNAFFYENSEGLFGGVVVAAGIAAMNMGAALILGYAFRFRNLVSLEKKVLGWASLVAFAVVVIFCNALFAAFRSEYQMVVDPSEMPQVAEAFRRAWPEAVLFFKADMQFKDHWSFILFGVGIVLSIWAFWKGYTIDDKYPGHGDKHRTFTKALQEEKQLHENVRQKVKDLLHRRKSAVQAALHEPATQVGMLARRIADLTHARAALESQASSVQRDYSLVVEAYRHANTATRSVKAPAYFNEPTTLTTRVDASASDRVIEELTQVQGELKALSELHRDPLNAKLKSLQDDTSSILTKVMGTFITDVQAEAEEEIARMTPAMHRVQAA